MHICARKLKNKMANRKWVIEKLAPKIRSQYILNGEQAYEYMLQEYNA